MIDAPEKYGKCFHKKGFEDGQFTIVSKDPAIQGLGSVIILDEMKPEIWDSKLIVLDKKTVDFDIAEILGRLKDDDLILIAIPCQIKNEKVLGPKHAFAPVQTYRHFGPLLLPPVELPAQGCLILEHDLNNMRAKPFDVNKILEALADP